MAVSSTCAKTLFSDFCIPIEEALARARMVGVLMTQPQPAVVRQVNLDVWTSAYRALDD